MVKITNLNRRLETPTDKAVKGGKKIPSFTTGPTKPSQDFFKPDPFLGKFKSSPRSDSFYQTFPTEEAQMAQFEIDNRTGFYGNTFEGQNNIQAQNFLTKYYSTLGGSNTTEGKGLIEPDRIVRPENLVQLSSQPATGGGAVQDPNVAGRFPSNSVAV